MNEKIDDNYWMNIVNVVATASTCRVNVGCILVKNKIIVGTGYVGSVSGDIHCSDVGCLLVDNHYEKGSGDSGKSCIRTVHAEVNAVLKCRERGDGVTGWITSYSTFEPCLDCFKALLSIGVRKIIYQKLYRDLARDLFLGEFLKFSDEPIYFFKHT